MPQFAPSSVHQATIAFSNPKSAGFDYAASLCMGTDVTEMASASFHLDAGQSKAVTFSVTMPAVSGTYPVYISVSSGGKIIALYKATEDVVIAPVGVAVSGITVSPTNLTNAKHEYNTSLGLGYWGDPFTISITFSNPLSDDVWVRPDYALGKLTGEPLEYVEDGTIKGFAAEKLIYVRLLLNTQYTQGDYSYTNDWQRLWNEQNYGSNMVLGIYDPDGVPRLIGAADYWVKIPAGSTKTVVKQAHLGSKISVALPAVFDLCVVAWKVWYLVYDPGYGQQRVGSKTVVVNWRPVELPKVATAIPNLVTITKA